MADSSVLLEVIVEGKNIKLVQRDVEELGSSINKASMAEEKGTKSKKNSDKQNKKNKKSLGDLNNEQNNYNRGQKGVAGATSNGTKAFSKQRDLIGGGSSGLVGAYATLAANIFAATALFGALQRASQLQKLEEGLLALGAASGLALKSLSKGLVEATDSAVSLEQAMRTVATATSAGIDPSQLERFGKAAKNASNALGRDLSDTLDRVIRGVTKLEPELLDEIGVFVRLDDAVEKYASSIGKSASELTEFERRLAFQNETLGQLETKFGSLGDSVDSNPYNKLAASLNDLVKSAGEFLKIFDPVVKLLASSPIALIGTLTFLARGVLQQAAGAMFTFGVNTEKSERATKKLGKSIAREIPALGSKAKALKSVSSELNRGVISTNSINRAISQQNSILAGLITKNNNGKLSTEALTAAQSRSLAVTNKLTVALASLRIQQALNNVNLALAALAQGRYNLSLKIAKRAIAQATAGVIGYTSSLKGLSLAAAVARLAVTGLALSFKLLGVAIFVVVPYLAAIAAALAIAYEAYKFIADLFRTEEEKAYREELEKTSETLKELSSSLREVATFQEGLQGKITSVAQKYEALGNSVTTAVRSFEDLRASALALEDGEELQDFNQKVSDFIEKNKVLSDRFKELNGQGITSIALEDRGEAGLAVLKVIEKEANEQRSLTSAIKETTRTLQEFRAANRVTNEFTELADSLKVLDSSLQVVASSPNITQQFDGLQQVLSGFSNETLKEFGVTPRQIKNFKEVESRVKSAQEEIIQLSEANETASGKEILANEARIQTLKKTISNERQRIKILATGISASVAARAEEVKAAERALSVNKQLQETQKTYVSLLKETGNTSEASISGIVQAENNLLSLQQQKNTAILNELNSREYTATQLDEQIADQLEIGRLTLENAVLEAKKTTELEAQVKVQQGNLTNLQTEQKFLKAASSELAKQAANRQAIVTAQMDMAKGALELQRAQSGQSLTTGDELGLAKEAEAIKKAAAAENLQLKITEIRLEYDLLEAKYALMRAEINAAKEAGNLTEAQASRALTALDNVDLAAGRKGAEERAATEYVQAFTKAELEVAKLREKVRRETDQRAIDAVNRRAEIAELSGAVNVAAALREEALVMERAMIEADITAGKANGLDMAEKEVELAQKINDLIAERLSNTDTRGFGAAGAAAIQGAASVAAVEDAGGSPEAVAEAKAEAGKNVINGVAEQMKALGPEGELMSTVLSSSTQIADAFGSAFQAIGEEGATMGQKVQAGLAVAQTVIAAFSQISKAASDAKIRGIDNEIAAEKKRDGTSKASLAKIAKLEAKKEAAKKKAFETEKKMKIAQTIIGTAQGVTAMLGAAPPPVNFALAAAVGVMGLKQLQMIQATSYQGGGSAGSGSASPPTIALGQRRSTVDLATSQSASGEQSYLRGQAGTGGPENFRPAFMGANYRANGGATAGYVVGEQGPELFVPNSPGTIVPNPEIGGGGVPINATFNINTIDASGVEEVLSGQRGNIIGMLRDSANSYGQGFFEEIDTMALENTSNGAARRA